MATKTVEEIALELVCLPELHPVPQPALLVFQAALMAALRTTRDEAYEEAARECEAMGDDEETGEGLATLRGAAERIRSLRGKP